MRYITEPRRTPLVGLDPAARAPRGIRPGHELPVTHLAAELGVPERRLVRAIEREEIEGRFDRHAGGWIASIDGAEQWAAAQHVHDEARGHDGNE